jgi:hypothetical protein
MSAIHNLNSCLPGSSLQMTQPGEVVWEPGDPNVLRRPSMRRRPRVLQGPAPVSDACQAVDLQFVNAVLWKAETLRR